MRKFIVAVPNSGSYLFEKIAAFVHYCLLRTDAHQLCLSLAAM
jgi:hypothetical protein